MKVGKGVDEAKGVMGEVKGCRRVVHWALASIERIMS